MESTSSCSSPELRRLCLNSHITALKVFHDYLLVAETNEVLVYNWRKKCFLQSIVLFDGVSIHGINIGANNKILFFGAKCVKVVSIEIISEKWKVETLHVFHLHDWVLDAAWITPSEEHQNSIAIVTAHNSLMLCNLSDRTIKNVQCVENCILYSANIIANQQNAIILAVGTVFKKILLWSPNSKIELEGRKIPFHQLTGHQGVIFSITFCEKLNILCSTSDDRSLRVWKIQNNSAEKTNSLASWESSSINILYALFAHESRVWRCAILDSSIISIGEDSFICFWDLNGHLKKRIKGHKGGSIWCLETCKITSSNAESPFKKEVAFTGGSDGGVYIWEASEDSYTEAISQISLYRNDQITTTDFPRVCSFLTHTAAGNFIVSTDEGCISLYNMATETWKDIFYDTSFASYCVVSVSYNSFYLSLGNMFGDLVLLNIQEFLSGKDDYKKFRIHDSKICSLHWVNKSSNIILSCGKEGRMALWKIVLEKELKIQCIHRYYLQKCKNHWWSTSALLTNSHNVLIVGDRGGTISVYNHFSDTGIPESWNPAAMMYRKIHGDNGVTHLEEHMSFVYSAGRDGKVNQFIIADGSLKLLHSIKVSHDLEWIGKILFYKSHLLLLGFHTKDFVLWSTQLESAIMTVECGGGHRSWDFYLDNKGLAVFVAIKKKDIIYCKQDLNNLLQNSVLKVGLSGQKFSCLTYLFTKSDKDTGSMSVLACGGEDNTVRIIGITNIPDESPKIVSLNSLSGHLSSIRAIGVAKMTAANTWLLASVGGRSQLMIWKLEAECDLIKCEQLLSQLLSNPDDKPNIQWKKNKENQCFYVDPQTRLMDVSVLNDNCSLPGEETFKIALACSDSYFRLYKFESTQKKLFLCHIIKNSDNCILKVIAVDLKFSTGHTLYVTGATNGSMKILSYKENICDSNKNISNIHSDDLEYCHQSGINAIDCKHIDGDSWMICSGGDDNKLMAVVLKFDLSQEQAKVEIISKCHQVNAHASQITGIRILDEKTLVSASIDQRINVWKIDYNSSMSIHLFTSAISFIPDIACLHCWQTE